MMPILLRCQKIRRMGLPVPPELVEEARAARRELYRQRALAERIAQEERDRQAEIARLERNFKQRMRDRRSRRLRPLRAAALKLHLRELEKLRADRVGAGKDSA